MSSKTQNVGHFVEYRLKRICKFVFRRSCKRHLWQIYAGESGQPQEIFRSFWELFLQDLRRNVKQKRCANHAQWAVYIALTLFALHQQGKRFAEGIYVSARKRSGKGSGLFDTW